MKLILSKKLLSFFKSLLFLDKEVAGKVRFEYNFVNKTFRLDIDENQDIKKGTTQDVVPLIDNITFHSHPIKAYLKYKTPFGWPSLNDYRVLFTSFQKMIMHIVVSREGLWIIMFHKNWLCIKNNLNFVEIQEIYEKLQKKIKQINQYMISYSNLNKTVMESFYEYKNQINRMVVDKLHVFNLSFHSWNKIKKTKIKHFQIN